MPVVNYTNNHNTALVEFVASHNSTTSELQELCRNTFRYVLGQPGLVPLETCLVLEQDGQIKGLALVYREFPISRSVIEVIIAPELAGGPDELEILRRAVSLVKAEHLSVADVCVMPGTERGKLLEQLGFSPVRTYLDMLWNQDQLPDVSLPSGYSVRSFQNGDTALLTKVQNAAFIGSWGFCPNTEEQIEYRTGMPNTSKEGILFLFEGDRPAGYCWTVIVPSDNGPRGIIGMIGVVPEYRGKGVSRHVLHAGMQYLRSIGMAEVGLEVDGNNDPAVRLYTSMGFKKMGERHWFELDLPGT